jgi:hypothetical protein
MFPHSGKGCGCSVSGTCQDSDDGRFEEQHSRKGGREGFVDVSQCEAMSRRNRCQTRLGLT